jgi:hypothetical protein
MSSLQLEVLRQQVELLIQAAIYDEESIIYSEL